MQKIVLYPTNLLGGNLLEKSQKMRYQIGPLDLHYVGVKRTQGCIYYERQPETHFKKKSDSYNYI